MRLITDENGTVKKRYNYTAFGSILSDSGSFENDYRYTSQAIDENDLYYMHARYYDNSIGRFTSCDPANSGHSYNYTPSNPTNFTDPMGLMYNYQFANITCMETGPSVEEWNMRACGLGSDFIDASGQTEHWYYTDLWMQLGSEFGYSEDKIELIANAINLLHNPVYSIEQFSFEGINIGEFADEGLIDIGFFVSYIPSNATGTLLGSYNTGTNFDGQTYHFEIAVSELLVMAASSEKGYGIGFGFLMQAIGHELAHAALSYGKGDYVPSTRAQEGAIWNAVNAPISGLYKVPAPKTGGMDYLKSKQKEFWPWRDLPYPPNRWQHGW